MLTLLLWRWGAMFEQTQGPGSGPDAAMLGGCSVIVAIIFYFAWTWFLTVMR